MRIKLNESDFEKINDNLQNILINKGVKIIEINNKRWSFSDEKNTQKRILLKGDELLKYLNENFGTEYKWSDTSVRPSYSIVNEEEKEISVIMIRQQNQSGTTDQKLPYGEFALGDYLKQYEVMGENYDVKISFVLNEFFSKGKYSELKDYLKSKSINAWVKEIKI